MTTTLASARTTAAIPKFEFGVKDDHDFVSTHKNVDLLRTHRPRSFRGRRVDGSQKRLSSLSRIPDLWTTPVRLAFDHAVIARARDGAHPVSLSVRTISAAEHAAWAADQPWVSFLQLPSWGPLKSEWQHESVGWFDDDHLYYMANSTLVMLNLRAGASASARVSSRRSCERWSRAKRRTSASKAWRARPGDEA